MVALCSSLRHTLDAVFRARGERKAALYKLQVTTCSTNAWLKVYKDLGYPMPVASMSNQAMERASKNLQGFDLFTGMKDSNSLIGTVMTSILPSWLTNSSNAPRFNDGHPDFRRLVDWAKHLEEVSSAGREAMKHAFRRCQCVTSTIGFPLSWTMVLWSLSGKSKKLWKTTTMTKLWKQPDVAGEYKKMVTKNGENNQMLSKFCSVFTILILHTTQVILETVDALFLGLALCLEDAWSVHDLDGMEGGRCVVVVDEGSFKLWKPLLRVWWSFFSEDFGI